MSLFDLPWINFYLGVEMSQRQEEFYPPLKSRIKNYFYDKASGLGGFEYFKKDEEDLGYTLYFMRGNPHLNRGAQENLLLRTTQSNFFYVFLEETAELFCIRNQEALAIPIKDIKKFQHELKAILDNDNHFYLQKFLTAEEIKNLITLNSDHVPDVKVNKKLPNSFMKDIFSNISEKTAPDNKPGYSPSGRRT
jgi:hypothetical protein